MGLNHRRNNLFPYYLTTSVHILQSRKDPLYLGRSDRQYLKANHSGEWAIYGNF